MTRLRHISVWLLLVAFAAGGVVGPVAHQIQHGARQLAAVADEPCHSPAVHHADGPLWTGEGTSVDTRECDLCATRLLVVLPTLVPPSSPKAEGTTRVQVRTHVAPRPVVANRSIRGPPTPPDSV